MYYKTDGTKEQEISRSDIIRSGGIPQCSRFFLQEGSNTQAVVPLKSHRELSKIQVIHQFFLLVQLSDFLISIHSEARKYAPLAFLDTLGFERP